ncbi:MAG: RecQ family ATP-dependent DNA helicase, partial [Planctomycetota bacterium]
MSQELQSALQEHFGFPGFRGLQEEVIEHALEGGDCLVLMATGEGKSLCYQLPALISDGLTLVVSPLIALMDDQVLALERRGLPASCIHSMLDRKTRQERMAKALAGELSLLYVTPERFRVGKFLDEIKQLSISLLAIDEAHCVSQWGHDFRPDYSQLGKVREALGQPTCMALTATATPEVQADIKRVLGIPDAKVFHSGIERPNLFLAVEEVFRPEDKLAPILRFCEEIGGPGIIYTALIKDLLHLEGELQRRGFKPLIYHGKLSASERREQQKRFIDSDNALILATNAFGMGVDKPDIRFILHYQIPRTLEAYYQEIGRAGRD